MNLPEALEPWAAALAVVAPDVATSLGPWLARLAPAVGPLRARTHTGAGDPDGYDGLTRRGPYERMLLTEWLLADEAPDEFLRRAAMGELGFHQLVRRETAKARTSVALFDAGPTQLGAPRIAHIATLLLLAQRAHDAGARFGWAVLQLPAGARGADGELRLGVTPGNVDGLATARRATCVCDDDASAWAAFERRSGPWDDVWIVGPAESYARWIERVPRRPGATGGHVEPLDVLEAGARRLIVRVRQRSVVREVELELPDDPTCTRLLRSPLRRVERAALPPRPHPGGRNRGRPALSNAVLAPSGSKVIARTTDGALLVFGVPGSSRGGTPRPRVVVPRPGERFLAAGWGARRLVLLSDHDHALRLYDWNGNVFPWLSAERPASAEARDALLALADSRSLAELHVYRTAASAPRTAAVVDREGRSWRLDPHGAQCDASGVVAAAVLDEQLRVVVSDPSPPASLPGGAVVVATGARACLASSSRTAAVERAPCLWSFSTLAQPAQGEVTAVPTDVTVFGAAWVYKDPAPALYALTADRAAVVVWRQKEQHRVFAAPSPIRHATLDVRAARFAYVTDGGALGVYDLARNEELMRHVPEGL